MKTALALLIVALLSFKAGISIGRMQERDVALDAAVEAQCAREVPVVAVWDESRTQVIYHFSATPDQTRARWCKNGGLM